MAGRRLTHSRELVRSRASSLEEETFTSASPRARLALASALAAGALAQESPAPAPASPTAVEDVGLEEIVITARKREESLQDAPIQATALSKQRIEQLDATSLEKIAGISPQLFVARTSNGSGAQITMRGIGSSSTSIGLEQSVAVVLDGVYFGQGRG